MAAPSLEVRNAQERVLSMTQKRLRDSLKGWDLHVAARNRGKPMPVKLKLFEPTAGTT